MKRWWLVIGLLLSLGVNLGLLASVGAQRRQPPAPQPSPTQSPRPEERRAEPQPSPTPPAGQPPVTVEEAPERPTPEPERRPASEERPAPPRRPAIEEEPFEPEGPPPGGPEPGMGGAPPRIPPLPRLADHLGLEGEKRRRFLDVQWQFFQRTSRLRLQQSEVQRELRRALTRGEPDRQAIDKLLQESARIHLALERALVENVVASRELLSDEQTRMFLQLLGRMRREAGRNPEGPPPAAGRRPLRRWQEGQGRPFDRRLPGDERGGPEPPSGPEGEGPPPP